MRIREFDFVIVGSGLAGLVAAENSSRFGSVLLLTKSAIDRNNSFFAQGGVAASIGGDDSISSHVKDTEVAGRGLCDRESIEILVKEGVDDINNLIDQGMSFDREDGEIILGLEGGHSNRRVLHAGGDITGKRLVEFFRDRVLDNKNIEIDEFSSVVELLTKSRKCSGVLTVDLKTQETIKIISGAVILATGGVARIFKRSSNPDTATGDGLALAYRAGATLQDMEFIQFHPSVLDYKRSTPFLISEAVRGEGAYLVNSDGVRFMEGKHPLAELAPRDVVALSIYEELQQEDNRVFLKLSHLDRETIVTRFRGIFSHLKDVGLDLVDDLIPVAPAAHYMVGGVKCDIDGQTDVKGLYVCGEIASTGVMGANRLASNSLLECIVFGRRAVDHAAANLLAKDDSVESESVIFRKERAVEMRSLFDKIAELMSSKVGIVRDRANLLEAIDTIDKLREEYSYNSEDFYSREMSNRLTVCSIIATASLLREESRGGHIRLDFPNSDESYRKHSTQKIGEEIKYIKVTI